MCNTCHDFLWMLAFGTLNATGLQSSSVDIVFDSTETQQRNVSQSEPNVLIWSDWSYCLTPPELRSRQEKLHREFFFFFFLEQLLLFYISSNFNRKKTEVVTGFGLKNPKWMSHNSSYVSADAVIEKRHLQSAFLSFNH